MQIWFRLKRHLLLTRGHGAEGAQANAVCIVLGDQSANRLLACTAAGQVAYSLTQTNANHQHSVIVVNDVGDTHSLVLLIDSLAVLSSTCGICAANAPSFNKRTRSDRATA